MKFHEALARTLKAHGVQKIFGLMGDANLYAVDSFVRDAGGQFFPVVNEATCVLAANGYARISGELGVASVTHGPALTNTVTALVEGCVSAPRSWS
ncbi:thiamine pyrophosphate-binding protein [Nocardioides alcanivorans]|uniref:thiamine pyrophosphate-binding protein n=1 Tax=Nocardioides alcanivorans TaxID=2897352 RepID=UPI0024B1B804|nr:thiamine pyrophosphate-binding protein [Nocardioides alcanivorans]